MSHYQFFFASAASAKKSKQARAVIKGGDKPLCGDRPVVGLLLNWQCTLHKCIQEYTYFDDNSNRKTYHSIS